MSELRPNFRFKNTFYNILKPKIPIWYKSRILKTNLFQIINFWNNTFSGTWFQDMCLTIHICPGLFTSQPFENTVNTVIVRRIADDEFQGNRWKSLREETYFKSSFLEIIFYPISGFTLQLPCRILKNEPKGTKNITKRFPTRTGPGRPWSTILLKDIKAWPPHRVLRFGFIKSPKNT